MMINKLKNVDFTNILKYVWKIEKELKVKTNYFKRSVIFTTASTARLAYSTLDGPQDESCPGR